MTKVPLATTRKNQLMLISTCRYVPSFCAFRQQMGTEGARPRASEFVSEVPAPGAHAPVVPPGGQDDAFLDHLRPTIRPRVGVSTGLARSRHPSVSQDPATGVIGRWHRVEPGVLGEHARYRLRTGHVIGLAVDIVQVDPVALVVPHDADEFVPGHTALREKVTPPSGDEGRGVFVPAFNHDVAQGPLQRVPCTCPSAPYAALGSGGSQIQIHPIDISFTSST